MEVSKGVGKLVWGGCLALGVALAPAVLAQDEPESGTRAAAAAAAPKELGLYVGSVKTLKLGTVTRLAVGNDSVLAASVLDSGEVLLIPKATGISDLQVWSDGGRRTDYQVRVDQDPVAERLATVRAIASNFPNVTVREANGSIILAGFVEPDQYDRLAGAIQGIEKVVNLVRPGAGEGLQNLISFDVKIVEISKQFTKNLGIRWQDTAGGPSFGIVSSLIPNSHIPGIVSPDPGGIYSTGQLTSLLGAVGPGNFGVNTYLGWTAGINSQLEMLEANNAARILAEPRLSTLSGEKANFLAGGELPIAVLNEFGQPVVTYKDYGIQLEINPVADRENNIHCKMHAEVSSIDESTKVNGVPGLLDRSTDSTISARPGDTIAISGLVSVNDSRVINEVPAIGNLPIIGALFKDKEFQTQRTDLLILVTPRIQAPNEPVDPEIQRNIDNMKGLLGGSAKLDTKLLE